MQEGRIGITSISLDPHDSLGITYSEHAELADARSGKTFEHISWPNLESGITKAIARDGPGAWVAISAPAVPRDLQPGAGPLVGLGSLRRIFPLRAPDAGPPRFIGANNTRELVLIDHTGHVRLHPERMAELHAVGALVASLSFPPRKAHVFDLAVAPLELATCPAPDANAIALLVLPTSPSPLILLADSSGISAYDLDCRLVADFASKGEPLVLAAVPYDLPTRAIVAAGTREGRVEIWDWSGKLLATLGAHTFPVRALDFTPDTRTLASGAWDGRLRFYDMATLLAPSDSLIANIRAAWGPR